MTTNQPLIIYNIKWDTGAHASFSGSLYSVLYESIQRAMTTTQFFFGSPKSYNRCKTNLEDLNKALQLCNRFPTNVFSHFPYIANLAGSKDQLAWDGDDMQDKKTSNVIKELQYELGVLANFNKKRNGVVIHPGNYTDRKIGLATIAKSINKIDFPDNSKLLLENSAGQGTSLATTFEEIQEIIRQVDPDKQKHIGVCVDTAHIFGYGLYNLSKCSEVKKMFEDFDRIIGLDKWTLLHLNDSEVPLGCKKDRHACLGTGYIWGQSFDSLHVLLDTCKEYGIPSVLETHELDMITLSQLSELSR